MRIFSICTALLCLGCSSVPSTDTSPGAELNPGVRAGATATFEASHDFVVNVPEGATSVDLWFATPNPNDRMQRVSGFEVDTDYEYSFVTDNYGNRFVHLHLVEPPAGSFDVKTRFTVQRSEALSDLDPSKTRPHSEAERVDLARYLVGSSQSVIDADARAMASNAVGDETNPVLASRKIYDAVLERVEYHVKDAKPDSAKTMKSTGKGNSQLCYASCTGNCTDFHSLYAAVSRAAGIPTRVVYGSFFKGPLDGQPKDQSYHCWVEFHAPNLGWIPLDVAVADIFVDDFVANEHSRPRANLTVADGYRGPDPALVDYYFGNLDARRVTWHWGRDLVLNPPQNGPPLLWNPKAYAEVDGEPASIVKRTLTYREIK